MINDQANSAKRVTWIGFVVNTLLIIVKLIAGILGTSSALIADAIHSLSDSAGDLVVLSGIKLAQKPVDDTHNYGHGKFETLSAIIISISLIVVAAGILWNGVVSVYDTLKGIPVAIPAMGTLIAVVLSIVVKEALFHYTIKTGKALNSPLLIANAWHHRSDALSSVAVLVGISGALFLGEHWVILDPVAAIVVSIFIFKMAGGIMKDSIDELLEASLSKEHQQEIIRIVSDVPGVSNPHRLKTRRIGINIAIDMHIHVNPKLSIIEAHNISTNVEKVLAGAFGPNTFISIHVEPEGDPVLDN